MNEGGRTIYSVIWLWVVFFAGCAEKGSANAATDWTDTAKLSAAVVAVVLGLAPPLLAPKVRQLVRNMRLSEECRRRLEEAREEIQRMSEKLARLDHLKTQYFVNISHELRTPIALVLGPVERLLADEGLTPSQRRDLEVVERNAKTLLKHVDSLLDLSELEAGRGALKEDVVDLAQMLRLTGGNFDLLAEDNQILFSIVTPASVVTQVDAGKIERVFFTLLSNAFHSAPSEGEVECRMTVEDGEVVTTVRDSGPGPSLISTEAIFGIEQENPPNIDAKGIEGLGMAIAKEFVELHGGTITVEKNKAGSRFQVALPLKTPSGQPESTEGSKRSPPAHSEPGASRNGSRKESSGSAEGQVDTQPKDSGDRQLVLVVEDNPEMNLFISQTLAAEYRTISAFDGEEGLRTALAQKPDLIVSDLMMPRMSGDEMVKELRAHDGMGVTPVVILTAVADEALRFSLLQDYVQDYILKPVRGPVLRARVKNLLRARKRELQLRTSEQQLQALAARLVSIQEEERSRLARELHDDLNQQLAALSIGLGSLHKRLPEDESLRDQIRRHEQQLAAVSQQVREIAHRLHPPAMEYLGLSAALKSHCEVFSRQTGVHVDIVDRDVPKQLPPMWRPAFSELPRKGFSM